MPTNAMGLVVITILLFVFGGFALVVVLESVTSSDTFEWTTLILLPALIALAKSHLIYIVREFYDSPLHSIIEGEPEGYALAIGLLPTLKLMATFVLDVVVLVLLLMGSYGVAELLFPTSQTEFVLIISQADKFVYFIALAAFISIRTTYLYAPHFIVFYDMSLHRAIRCSFMMSQAHYWRILVVYIAQICMYVIGLCVMCIGFIFTLPAAYGIRYSVFEQYGLYQDKVEPSEKDVLDHLIS